MQAQDPKAPVPQQDPQPSEDPSQAEPAEAQDPAQEEPEAQPDADGAAGDPEAGGNEPADPKPAGHKRQGGYQRQIARLERQNQQLLEALQRSGVGGGLAPATGKEKTPEELAAEHLDRLVDQRLQQREAERAQREQVERFQAAAAEARAQHEDFDEAIATLDIPTTSPLGQALLTSEAGPRIMYELASNPAELARLSALPPFAAAREIGKLEAQVSGATPQKTAIPAKRPPEPPSKVGGSSARPTRSLETLPISEYKKAYRSGRR